MAVQSLGLSEVQQRMFPAPVEFERAGIEPLQASHNIARRCYELNIVRQTVSDNVKGGVGLVGLVIGS